MVIRDKKIVVTLSLEEKERVRAAAEKDGFVSLTDWSRVQILGSTTVERKEKTTSGKKKNLDAMWIEDVAYKLNLDSGSPCPGSEQIYPYSQSMGKYPGAICEFCRVEHIGREVSPGQIQVREHLDGVQSDEEVGFIESLGKEVDDTRAIGEREGF